MDPLVGSVLVHKPSYRLTSEILKLDLTKTGFCLIKNLSRQQQRHSHCEFHSTSSKVYNMKKIVSKMIFTVACISFLFKFVAGKSANEQDVLNAFTEVYDIMYGIRDAQAKLIQELRDNQTKLIQELRDNDFEKTEEIKFLKLQIEELQKIKYCSSYLFRT